MKRSILLLFTPKEDVVVDDGVEGGAGGTYHFDEHGDAVKPIIIKTIRGGKGVVWEG